MQEFELFTDPARMRLIFQQHLPGFDRGDWLINDCQLLWSRYKTYLKARSRSKSFLCACYQLSITDPHSQEQDRQILYAKACLEGRSQEEFQRATALSLALPRFGRPLVHLPELDLVVWAFPNDPQLLHLAEVIQPQRVIRHLPYHCLPAGFNTPKNLGRIEVEVIHYYPEQRCTTRYQLQAKESGQALCLFGKTFRADEGREIYRRMAYLWQKSLAEPDGFIVAQPLEYNDKIKTIWQANQPGTPLIRLINRTNYQPLLKAVAQGLVSLHQSELASPVKKTFNDHLTEVRAKIDKLGLACPMFIEPLGVLLRDLEKSAPDLALTPERLIYGDFHLRQLSASGDRIVFFDFDEFALGDPMQDLANFMVDLHFHHFESDLVKRMATTLAEAYRVRANGDWSPDRLCWHLRLQFITRAYRFYRQQKPNLEQAVQRIMTLTQPEALVFS